MPRPGRSRRIARTRPLGSNAVMLAEFLDPNQQVENWTLIRGHIRWPTSSHITINVSPAQRSRLPQNHLHREIHHHASSIFETHSKLFPRSGHLSPRPSSAQPRKHLSEGKERCWASFCSTFASSSLGSTHALSPIRVD